MVTNDMTILPKARHIIELSKNGRLRKQGSPTQFTNDETVSQPLPVESIGDISVSPSKDALQGTDSALKQDSTDIEAVLATHPVWSLVWHHFKAAGLRYAFCEYLLRRSSVV